MRLSDRYILRNHVGPFFIGLGVLTFVFVIDLLYTYLDMLLVNKVPALAILELFALSLGHILALTIPMAVLVATMLAFSQMVAENEITAMRSGGISLYRIIAAPLLAALGMTIFMILFNNFVLPESNHRLANLLRAVRTQKPALDIRAGRFIDAIPDHALFVGRKDEASGRMEEVFIIKEGKRADPLFITAQRARLQAGERSLLKMNLDEGEQFEVPLVDASEFQITAFEKMEILIHDIERDLKRRDYKHRSDRELSVPMMNQRIADQREEIARFSKRIGKRAEGHIDRLLTMLDAEKVLGRRLNDRKAEAKRSRPKQRSLVDEEENALRSLKNLGLSRGASERKIRRYQVEVHKKFSIAMACLVFILMGAPVAIKTGRSGNGGGIAFSIVLFTVYYIFLVTGEELADRTLMAPWLAMWLPNLLLMALGVWMLFWANRESRTFSMLNPLYLRLEERRQGKR